MTTPGDSMLVIGRPRAFCIIMLAGVIISPVIIETQVPGLRVPAYVSLVMVLAIPLCAWNWSLRLDGDGIEQRALFKRWRLAWTDVDHIVITKPDDFAITVKMRDGGEQPIWPLLVDRKVEEALRLKVEVIGSMWDLR